MDFTITIKGNFPILRLDSSTRRSFVDLSRAQYGKIKFSGSMDELNKFIDDYFEDESECKIIGVYY